MNSKNGFSVSVVIPFHRNVDLLKRAVESVLAQSQPVHEIIIIDDRSDADWWTVILQMPIHSRLNACCLRQNQGPSVARNLGVELATGSYVAFLDADDFWHPHFVRFSTALICTQRVDMVFSRIAVADEAQIPELPYSNYNLEKVDYQDLLWRNRVNTSSVVLKREKFSAFPESLRHCEDYFCWLGMLWEIDHALLYDPPLSFHRKRQGYSGLSATRYLMRRGEFVVVFTQYKLGRIGLCLLVARLLKLLVAIIFNDTSIFLRRVVSRNE